MPLAADPPLARPASCTDLFVAFTSLAMQGFGGVLPIAQRVLCEQRRWLTRAEFVELLAIAQVLPGPNVCNLAVMIGDRYFGLRGALSALAGMLAAPLVVVVAVTLIYAPFASEPMVAGALRGMGAVTAGMIAGTSLKLAASLRGNVLGPWVLAAVGAAAFVAIALLRLPLFVVLPVLGVAACTLAGWRLHKAVAERSAP